MSLSCSCEFDIEPGQKYCYPQDDYSNLDTVKRKRCPSCKELIEIGAIVGKFDVRRTVNENEIAILGEDGEVKLAPVYLCEKCFDLYLSFQELGFCAISPWDNLPEEAKEYAAIYNADSARSAT